MQVRSKVVAVYHCTLKCTIARTVLFNHDVTCVQWPIYSYINDPASVSSNQMTRIYTGVI